MAPVSDDRFTKARAKESLFRQIATNICAYGSGYRIWAKDTNDLALFVPEGGEIPLESTIHDFTVKSVDSHKLAVFVKTDEDFIRDASFGFESYLVTRLAKNFGRAEENGFINGTGVGMPTGILAESNGADIGVTAAKLTYDDVVKLFFSVKPEYRRNGVWLMNDETASSIISSPWYGNTPRSQNSQRRSSESLWIESMCTRLKRSMGIECNASKLYTTASVSSPCRTQQKTKKRHSRYKNDYAEFFQYYKSLSPLTKSGRPFLGENFIKESSYCVIASEAIPYGNAFGAFLLSSPLLQEIREAAPH